MDIERLQRISRGNEAQAALDTPVLKAAHLHLKEAAFMMFVESDDARSRDHARSIIVGANALLDVLRNYVTDANIARREPDEEEVA